MKPALSTVAALIICGSASAQSPPPVPSKTPGGALDPLTLSKGMNIIATDPTVGNDANARRAFNLNVTTDSATSNSNFSDELAGYINFNATNGQNVSGGLTDAKKTFFPLLIKGTYTGAGQKFVLGIQGYMYGMGDSFLEAPYLSFAGGPISGDEGDGLIGVSTLTQQPSLVKTTITNVPTQSRANTTLAQAVKGGPTPQTVSVQSTTGCNVNDWIVVGQEIPSGTPNLEAVKITALGTGTITGVFKNNHNRGDTITPALVLNLASTNYFGQDRVLVNLSQPSYSTGTVSSIKNYTFTGSGTSWAENMVGGSATNVGAIALSADDYSGEPFNGRGAQGTLKSWYQIKSVGSGTSLTIHSYSTAGNLDYRGKGAGSYLIRPAARVLRVLPGVGVVCETSTATWAANDNVELAICPYPDVHGFTYNIAGYTPGGNYRDFFTVTNAGARHFSGAGFSVSGQPASLGSNADSDGFTSAFQARGVSTGLDLARCSGVAISLGAQGDNQGSTSDNAGKIIWPNRYLVPNTTWSGMELHPTPNDYLRFQSSSYAGSNKDLMIWTGNIQGGLPLHTDTLASKQLTATATTEKVLVLQLQPSATANAFEILKNDGTVIFSVDPNGTLGVAGQEGLYLLHRITTDATANVALTTDANAPGLTNQLVMPNNSLCVFDILIAARRTDTADYGAWRLTGTIKRDANAASTAILGSPILTTLAVPSGSWTAPSAVADTTNGGLQIRVTGAVSQTVRWVARTVTTEVTN